MLLQSCRLTPYSRVTCIDRRSVQEALNWLEENQDKPLEELQASQATGSATEGGEEEGAASAIPPGATAASLVCNECGKKFRNRDLAAFHASKT